MIQEFFDYGLAAGAMVLGFVAALGVAAITIYLLVVLGAIIADLVSER
jgi:hypothetical protein